MLCFQIHLSVNMKNFVAVDTIRSLVLVSAAIYCALQALEYSLFIFQLYDTCMYKIPHS